MSTRELEGPPPRKRAKLDRSKCSEVICLDYVKGKCDTTRWHCKFAHPPLEDLGSPDMTVTEKLLHLNGLTPEPGVSYCQV